MKKVRLSENELTKLIKKLIQEQGGPTNNEFVMSDVPLFYDYNVDDMKKLINSTDVEELNNIVTKIANARPNKNIEIFSSRYQFKPLEDFLYFYPNYIELLLNHLEENFPDKNTEGFDTAIKIYRFFSKQKKNGDKKGEQLNTALQAFRNFAK